MRKLDIISNLAYSLEGKLGWCPKPPTTKSEIATYHKDECQARSSLKFKWWFLFSSAFLLFLILAPPFVLFYVQLGLGIFAMVFFGIVGLTNIAHAYKEKENIYYLRIVISFLMCFTGIFIILGNFILVLIFFVTTIAISGLKYFGSRRLSSGVAETK